MALYLLVCPNVWRMYLFNHIFEYSIFLNTTITLYTYINYASITAEN